MRRRCVFLIISLLWAIVAISQEPTVTIRSSSELVTIPVLVTDKSGKPIHGLTKEQFAVIEDGKVQRTIAVFQELQGSPGPMNPAHQQEKVFSNIDSSDHEIHRVTIIVLDLLNTPFTAQAHARAELLKFLTENVRGADPIALLVISQDGLKQIHPLTTNPDVLVRALKKLYGKVSTADSITASKAALEDKSDTDDRSVMGETAQLNDFLTHSDAAMSAFQQRETIRITLAALEQIAQAFSGIPGRKTLIWASSGFPFLIEDPDSLAGFGTETLGEYERTFRAMNTANIAVYPVDAVGLYNVSYERFNVTRRSMQRQNTFPLYNTYQQSQDTLRAFAAATGGNACLNKNDLAECFMEAQQDSDSYYVLGYYLRSDDRKPGWHKLKVAVDRKDLHLRARNGFLIANPKIIRQQDTRKLEILTALGSPVDYTNLPLELAWGETEPDKKHPDRLLARFYIRLPRDSVTIDTDRTIILSWM